MTDDDGALTGRPLRLRVYLDERRWLGPGKADLLALIDETGSISAAGRRMKMSYKRAWDLIDAMNRHFATPVVETSKGGAGGGENNLAFKIKRKRVAIETLHLDTDGGVKERRTVPPEPEVPPPRSEAA